MGKRRYLLGLWIVANALVVSLLILNPMRTVTVPDPNTCTGDETTTLSRAFCQGGNPYEVERPFLERRSGIAGLVLGNGVALAVWVVTAKR